MHLCVSLCFFVRLSVSKCVCPCVPVGRRRGGGRGRRRRRRGRRRERRRGWGRTRGTRGGNRRGQPGGTGGWGRLGDLITESLESTQSVASSVKKHSSRDKKLCNFLTEAIPGTRNFNSGPKFSQNRPSQPQFLLLWTTRKKICSNFLTGQKFGWGKFFQMWFISQFLHFWTNIFEQRFSDSQKFRAGNCTLYPSPTTTPLNN